MLLSSTYSNQEEWTQGMRDDFRVFLEYIWHELGLPAPTKVQYDIASYLQHGGDRIGIMAFRGVGKSWITSAFAMWTLWRNPNERIMVLSATGQRAYDFGSFCHTLIERIPLLRALAPRGDQRSSKINFDVGPSEPHHSASMRSLGITGQLTGGRASLIIADDLETPDNSITDAARDKVEALSREFEAVLMPDTDTIKSKVVYLGTPQTQETIYKRKMESGYEFRIWPAKYPSDTSAYAHPNDDTKSLLAPMILKDLKALEGRPTDPERFDECDLVRRETTISKADFSLQFMLDTKLSDLDKYPFRTANITLMDLEIDRVPVDVHFGGDRDKSIPNVGLAGDFFRSPRYVAAEMIPYQRIVMAIDPSGRGADETSYAIVGEQGGRLYVLNVGGYTDGYSEQTLESLAKIAEEHSVNEVIIESNFGDGMFTSIFKPILIKYHKCSIEEVKHSVQKERRMIDTLLPIVNKHRLVVSRDCVARDIQLAGDKRSWVYQLTHLTAERGCLKHDDRLDALSIAVGAHRESLERSEEKALDLHKMRMIREFEERFKKNNQSRYSEILRGLENPFRQTRGRKRGRRRS